MLKQKKADTDSCKLYEEEQASTLPLQQNKATKGANKIDWDLFLVETARTMMPSFHDEPETIAAQKSVSYANALILELKETLRRRN